MRSVESISASRLAIVVAAAASMIAGNTPARACFLPVPLSPNFIRGADAVVIGRIKNYKIISKNKSGTGVIGSSDTDGRTKEKYTNSAEVSRLYNVTFEIYVEKILSGKALRKFVVEGNSPVFRRPDFSKGRYLIPLKESFYHELLIMEHPCSGAVLFNADSQEARDQQEILFRNEP